MKGSIVFFILMLSFSPINCRKSRIIKPKAKQSVLKPGKAIICIHGTLIPNFVRPFVHMALGPADNLIPMKDCPSIVAKISKVLHEADPDQFPEDAFYLYRWSGHLDFESRMKAAEELFKIICNHTGELIIIAHSHGCNVALNLAHIAASRRKSTFVISKLILLGPPVQRATEECVKSPLFKQVFSFYSTADVMQVADPQRLYSETVRVSKDRDVPFFSKRTFDESSTLLQARILFNRQSPGHNDFMTSRFLKRLPALIALVEKAHQEKYSRHFCINIPARQAPELIEKMELAHAYVPRAKRSCKCNKRPAIEA